MQANMNDSNTRLWGKFITSFAHLTHKALINLLAAGDHFVIIFFCFTGTNRQAQCRHFAAA
jgi:hypothetical protein